MIVFNLSCSQGHRFEGWFGSSDDFASQQARGLVSCPQCGCAEIDKAPMAPAVAKKGNQQADTRPVAGGAMPPETAAMLEKLARIQAEALKSSTWVGREFADHSRQMHYGERKAAAIHGQATADEARELIDEGINVSPLLFPVAPPEDLN